MMTLFLLTIYSSMKTQDQKLAEAFEVFKKACVDLVKTNNEIQERIGKPIQEITEFMEDFGTGENAPSVMGLRQNRRRVIKQLDYEGTQIEDKVKPA